MTKTINIFNSPIETGLRVLILLEAGYPEAYDIERLTFYDYFLIHSGDIEGGPESIHPSTPQRAGELLVRRPCIEKGLLKMISRGLVEKEYSQHGMKYVATELSSPFLDSLEASYTQRIITTAKWVINVFDQKTNEEIRLKIRNSLSVWGSEFLDESIIAEGEQ